MCGISGILNQNLRPVEGLEHKLLVMSELQEHRGPDDCGIWKTEDCSIGFSHRRLNIIDLDNGRQPMSDAFGRTVVFNGEIYNYRELRDSLKNDYSFRTESDTETILAAYHKWGGECVDHLRGMFAFAVWDSKKKRLFAARDRFGIKPFYYTEVGGVFYFASEIKALMPFLPSIETNPEALQDYLVFQFSLGTKTLFKNILELPPAYSLTIENGERTVSKYWEVYYDLDFDHTAKYFHEKLEALIDDSVQLHTRSDVPIGSYVSGGMDSSVIAAYAARSQKKRGLPFAAFTGKFAEEGFDESGYAKSLANQEGIPLYEVTIGAQDFLNTIEKVIYHLDTPVAGPGSFPQYHVSKLASQHRKVVLGGQGGDEIFGGYTRYLIGYFEQCIKAAINGTMNNGNFIVTYESIIPNLCSLKNYQPLLQEFWREGLFEDHNKRYFRLINRSSTLKEEIRQDFFGNYSPFESFLEIFHGKNIQNESYFDSMTHFDFKTLLKALLHVEDRMSMAHSVESRVPFLDHPLIEFAATVPSDVKFKDGTLKRMLHQSVGHMLPKKIRERKDKMGFPVPLNDWFKTDLKDFIFDLFHSEKIKKRPYFNQKAILSNLNSETKFGRKIWGLLSLEIWHQQFHDRHHEYKKLLEPQINKV